MVMLDCNTSQGNVYEFFPIRIVEEEINVINGCTDELACNYNSDANNDDESCIYLGESVDIINSCNSYTWIDGNTHTSSNSTATFTIDNDAGCDSIVTLNLTILNSTSGVDVQKIIVILAIPG